MRGPSGKWEVSWSKVSEVGLGLGKEIVLCLEIEVCLGLDVGLGLVLELGMGFRFVMG